MKDTTAAATLWGTWRVGMRTSLQALLGLRGHGPQRERPQPVDEEAIRAALLDMLPTPESRPSLQLISLRRRVQYAPDCDSLWYLRSDVLAALSADCGESQARQRIASLDPLFPRQR